MRSTYHQHPNNDFVFWLHVFVHIIYPMLLVFIDVTVSHMPVVSIQPLRGRSTLCICLTNLLTLELLPIVPAKWCKLQYAFIRRTVT